MQRELPLVSFIQKYEVWNKKTLLGRNGSDVFIHEYFNTTTEKNIRILLPIRREAIRQKRNVRLIEDRLTIDSVLYTVDNLDHLPPNLNPQNLATKTIENNLFFSQVSPLSNFHPSKFEVEWEIFYYGEQYIQAAKAKFFNDQINYDKIKQTKASSQMNFLGHIIKSFNSEVWETFAPKVTHKCQEEKIHTKL